MAFIQKKLANDPNQSQYQAQGINQDFNLSNNDSGSIQVGGENKSSTPNSSGSYTDLNSYLKANENQINDYADKVTGKLNEKVNTFNTGLINADNQFKKSVDENTFKQDKSWIDNVFNDPTKFVKNKQEVGQFTNIRDNVYKGNKSLSELLNPLNARNDINNIEDRARLFGQSEGREAILREDNQGTLYNPGLSNLDKALLQGSDSARNKFVNTSKQIADSNLTNQLTTKEQEADKLYKTTIKNNTALSNDAKSRFNPAFQKEKDTLQGYADNVNKTGKGFEDINKANYEKSKQVWVNSGTASNGQPTGYYVNVGNIRNPYDLDDSLNDQTFNNRIQSEMNLSNRDYGILRARESANMNTISTLDDLAKMNALNELGGSEFAQNYLDPNAYRSQALRNYGDGSNSNLLNQILALDTRRRYNPNHY